MGKIVVVVMWALCALPALISARRHHVEKPFILEGRVYCDTCRAGFETSATTYIPGIYYFPSAIYSYTYTCVRAFILVNNYISMFKYVSVAYICLHLNPHVTDV